MTDADRAEFIRQLKNMAKKFDAHLIEDDDKVEVHGKGWYITLTDLLESCKQEKGGENYAKV